MKNIGVLVLAAGKSTRMQGIKQLEKINDKTLLEITLEKAKLLELKDIFCVLGANAIKIKTETKVEDIHYITNKNFEKGLSSSIVAGMQHFKKNQFNFDGVLILLADQPAIEIDYLQSMILLFHDNQEKIIASNYANKIGVPAIFSKKYFKDLLCIQGDKGAKEFINQKKTNVICPQISANLTDIDTKEELSNFIKSKEEHNFKK